MSSRTVVSPPTPLTEPSRPLFTAEEYPTMAARVFEFEARVNSLDPQMRARVISEAFDFHPVAGDEPIAFLRRMLQDPDLWVRSSALRRLADGWVEIDRDRLPPSFVPHLGFGPEIRDDSASRERLRRHLLDGGIQAGWSANCLLLLRDEESVPELRRLQDSENAFVRHTAARALLVLGRFDDARVRFEADSDPASVQPGDGSLYYRIRSCRGLMALGGPDEVEGHRRLSTIWSRLADSNDPNDVTQLAQLRRLLFEVTGKFFEQSSDYAAWVRARWPG